MTNPFSNPSAPGAPDPAPRPRDLVGCLVAYSPRSLTKAGEPGNEKGVGGSAPPERVESGGSREWMAEPKPHYLAVVGPARFDGVWVSNENIVRFALAPGQQ